MCIRDRLQVHVAYLPVSYEHFGQSPYETYLINESNYHLDVYKRQDV